jgi:hypothetical protein
VTDRLVAQFGEVGATIERTLREHAEGLRDNRQRLADQQTQLGAQTVNILAMRREVLDRIETAETKLLEESGKVQRLLLDIKRSLGLNGSGGEHV